MGTIRKQGVQSSVLIYLAFILGGLNTMILLPKIFTPEEVGLTTIFINFATLFASVATMGILNTYVKFSPTYRTHLNEKDNDLPTITIITCIIGCLLLMVGMIVFKDFMIRKFSNHSSLFLKYYYWALPMTVTWALFSMTEVFCWMAKKTVLSNFTKEIGFRVCVTILIVLYFFKIINLNQFFILFTFIYLPGLLYLIYAIVKDGSIKLCFKFSKVSRRLYDKMLTFTLFHFSGTIIGILPKTVDAFIIASTTGLADAAVYGIANNIMALMEVPQRSLNGISAATISEGWKNKDTQLITNIYQKSSLNLLIIGFLIMGVVYPNMDNVVRFLPKYHMIKPIFFFIGIAKLIDLGTGANQFVLGYSKHWRVDFATNVAMIFVTIPLNVYCIRHFGLMGAAYGNAVGIFLYNLIRCLYIWFFFRMQPFTKNTFYAIVIVGIASVLPMMIPYLGNLFVDGIVRGLSFVVVYIPLILYFNVSHDFRELYNNFVAKVIRRKSN